MLPVPLAYVPIAQAAQAAPPVDEYPAMHGVHAAAPAAALHVPGLQFVHPALPVPLAYVPTGHAVHAAASVVLE